MPQKESWVTVRFIPCAIVSLGVSLAFQGAYGAEPWADANLPRLGGLVLWLDAGRVAAAAAKGDASADGVAAVEVWRDGSGNRRDLTAPAADARPTVRRDLTSGRRSAVVRFDGVDDRLVCREFGQRFQEVTIVLVAAPHSNDGGFRGLAAMNHRGQNDYVSGINIDQSGGGDGRFKLINVEGAGFGVQRDLMSADHPFGTFHTLVVTSRVGRDGVKLYVDGKLNRARDRNSGTIHADELRIGCRHYSNSADPTFDSGFFHGDIAEVLVYNRVLPDDERRQIEQYLATKHAELFQLRGLPPVTPVQMLAPGFTVKELPLALTNINDALYTADGRLFLLGYDGRIHVARDTNGDGLEDQVTTFWDKPTLRSPIGMVLAPEGLYVSSVEKISLFKDSDGDNRADSEEIVDSGWEKPDNYSGGVDALGLARAPDGSLYFALGCSDYTNAYRIRDGKSHYRLDSQRGTVVRLSPDRKRREIVATGVRFGVALAFNRGGDLFATDQEGETWLPGGNPLDELLHIQPGKHYGFPPRHEKWLPNVVDSPAAAEFGPQHQSTCGLVFNEPVVEGGRHFGPDFWRGDAIVAGYSRGKLWRVPLAKKGDTFTGKPILFAALKMLTLDTAIDPAGNLLVICHSGAPDWGSGPSGEGRLFKVFYANREAPQPVSVHPISPVEVQIAFNKELDPRIAPPLVGKYIDYGEHVRAGDRFETLRPGYYAVVEQQQRAARGKLRIAAASLSPDRQRLVLRTDPHPVRGTYALSIPVAPPRAEAPASQTTADPSSTPVAEASTFAEVAYDLHGLPWAPPASPPPPPPGPPPELAGADRANGERIFFGEKARCSACHLLRGKGGTVGPDLSNLVHRDAASVTRDITQPNAAINPDYVPYKLLLHDGRTLTGLVRTESATTLRVIGADAKPVLVASEEVETMQPAGVSIMPDDIQKVLSPQELKDLLAFVLLAPAQPTSVPATQTPAKSKEQTPDERYAQVLRTRQEVEAALAAARPEDQPPADASMWRPLNVLLVWGTKDHGPGEHDYPRWQREWTELLGKTPKISIRAPKHWPALSEWESAHLVVFFHMDQGYTDARYADLDAYQRRGGGLVLLHSAVIPKDKPEQFAERTGLAWNWGKTKFRHGWLDLNMASDHAITRGLPKSFRLLDETYWPMYGDAKKITVLATAKEEGREEPMLWTYHRDKARVVGCILGHYYTTFNDPLFRIAYLRSLAWAAGEPTERFKSLVLDGVKLKE